MFQGIKKSRRQVMVANRYLGGRAGGAWEEFAPARRLAARAARLRAELDDGGAGSDRWRLVTRRERSGRRLRLREWIWW